MTNLSALLGVLAKHDPMGLCQMGAPEDEYSPEAQVIMNRWNPVMSDSDLQQMLVSVFDEYFEHMITDVSRSILQKAASDVRRALSAV